MGSLHQCLKEKRYHQFTYLVKLGSNIEELDDRLHTPLISICTNISNEQIGSKLMRTLIFNGADTDKTDEEGLSPLHILCKRNKPSLVRVLLKLMADVSVSRCDIYGNTPLHYATAHENTELVSLLLPLVKRYQINADARNQLGFTPLLIAASNGRLAVARYLTKHLNLSKIIKDSLYFTSVDDWFKIYYQWSEGENILSDGTQVTPREGFRVQMEKDCLVPVSTKPAANLLLETFSRENSAAPHSKKNTKATGSNKSKTVPKIVVTSSSRSPLVRPTSAPNQKPAISRRSTPATPTSRTAASLDNLTRKRITLDMSNSASRKSEGRLAGRETVNSDSAASSSNESSYKGKELEYRRSSTNYSDKFSANHRGSLAEFSDICSEQLSEAYRRTIVPQWIPLRPEPEPEPLIVPQLKSGKGGKDANKAASILLGMLSKSRKQTSSAAPEDSTTEDDQTNPAVLTAKSNIKAKLLKMGTLKKAMQQAQSSDTNPNDDPGEGKAPSRAASLLKRAVLEKKMAAQSLDSHEIKVND